MPVHLLADRWVEIAVTQFLRGAKIINSLHPCTVPPWDLPTVLRALEGSLFETLQSSSLRVLLLKASSWAWSSGVSISDIFLKRLVGPRSPHLQGLTTWMSPPCRLESFLLK